MPSPILARADALMQRRRQHSHESDEIPTLTDALDEDDIPILLNAETPPPPVSIEASLPDIHAPAPPEPAPRPALEAAWRDTLAHELARRLEQRLASELPRLIESTVRDFLADHEMLASQAPRD